jgi:PAS domain S-box-containing protein
MGDSINLVARGLDQLTEGFGIFDDDLRLVSCNRPFIELRNYPSKFCKPGTSLETMIRFNCERGDFGPGNIGKQVAERMSEIRKSGHREIERKMTDGQILKIRYHHLENGGLTVTFEDTTEIRRAQTALAASEERYSLVSDAAEEAIYEWNIESDCFFSSPQLQELLGREFNENGVRDWRWDEWVHPEDVEHYKKMLQAHRSGETPRWECEYRVRDRHGEYRCISDHGTSIRNDKGEAVRMVAAVRDITDRVEREAALAASEERHTLVARATSDGLYDWDIISDFLHVSDRLNSLFDFDAGDITSRDWAQRVHVDDFDRYVEALRTHFKGDSDHLECEYRIVDKNGDYRWVRDHGVGVRANDGRVVRLVGAVRDVTDSKVVDEELQRAQARLRDSLETISDGFLLVGADDKVRLWNRRYMEIFSDASGGDISDLVFEGQSFFDMIRTGYMRGMFKPHPEGVDGWIADRRKARKDVSADFEMQLSDGKWLLINERQMSDGGRVSVYTDISEFKRRENETEAARARFEDAIEALSSGFVLFDAEDRIVISNSKYRKYFPKLNDMVSPGTPFKDIIQAAIDRGMFPQSKVDPKEWLAKLLKKRAATSGTREQKMEDGLWLQISDHRTKEGGIVSIYTDVTELKSREVELSEQSAILEATLENMDQAISMVDEDLNVVMFNQKFLEYMNFPKADFKRGFHMSQAFRFNAERGEYGEGDIDAQIRERLELSAQFLAHRFERTKADGVTLEIVGNPVESGGFVTTYTDISEAKRREADLMATKVAAERALQELQKAQDRLVQAEKMASLGQLTAGIAHEIKNPLNFINNFALLSAEMLAELADVLSEPIASLSKDEREDAEDLFETVKGNLNKINQHGRRADSIVKNMLLHSRDGPSEMQHSSLNAIAEEALNLAYHGARAENPAFNIEMVKIFSANVGEIDCFPQDLMRVFLNLVSNGMYSAYKRKQSSSDPNKLPTPTISMETREQGENVVVEVRDNGSGIPEEIRDKIFTPFFTTKPAGEGTGLGLSLSYDIVVKQHGGTMTVDSEPGLSTTFIVTLPRIAVDATVGGESTK